MTRCARQARNITRYSCTRFCFFLACSRLSGLMFSSPVKTRLQPACADFRRREFRLILLWRDAYQPGGGAGSETCGQDRQDPVIEGTEWRKLLASISATVLRDLRDRALIATLTYSLPSCLRVILAQRRTARR